MRARTELDTPGHTHSAALIIKEGPSQALNLPAHLIVLTNLLHFEICLARDLEEAAGCLASVSLSKRCLYIGTGQWTEGL